LFRRNGMGPDGFGTSTELKGDQPPAGIVAVSEQHLADVSFGPHYGLKAAVAAGPKSAQQATLQEWLGLEATANRGRPQLIMTLISRCACGPKGEKRPAAA
jgi:hypothetical protein